MSQNRVWQAAAQDAADVARLLIEFRDWAGSKSPCDACFHGSVARLLQEPNTVFLLASRGDASPAAGVCQLRYRHSVWTGVEDCWLEDLYVRSDLRGAGLGRELAGAACENARARGCARIELDVNDENRAAVSLYESLGFSARSKHMGSDASRDLLMGLRL
ncbi:MAG: GNAT family N-acetyltransferase [Solirubrobacteraceae bacterium]